VLGATLLAYGVGALTGNALGGRLVDRFGGRRPLLVVMPLFTAVLATLPLTATTVAGAAAALFALGTVGWATNAPVQSRLLALAPVGGSGPLLSLNASAIYLGAGLAGVVGGLVIAQAGVGSVPLVAAVLGLLAVALVLRRWHPAPPVPTGRVASPE
jgi:predicted MFS family arabinose efflux permease